MNLLNLFTIFTLIISITGQCLQEIISDTRYKCGKITAFDSTSSNFPSQFSGNGVQQISITGSITITNMCSAGYPFSLFTVKITPSTGEVSLFSFQISSANTIEMYIFDNSGQNQMGSTWTTSETLGQSSSFEFYLSLGLDNGYSRIITGLSTGITTFGLSALDFTGFKFDKTTKFEICTDGFGNIVVTCKVAFLDIEYQYGSTTISAPYQFFGGVDPTLIGSYTLDQTSGMTVKDQVNSLGSVNLGTATSLIPSGQAPTWASEGIEFTNSNQYISIPTFTPVSVTAATKFSFTINFWLKIESGATNGYIFRYARSDLTDVLAVLLDSGQKIKFYCGTTTSVSSSTLSYSTWTLMTFTFICFTETSTCYAVAYKDSAFFYRTLFYTTGTTILPFQSSDIVLLGGPNGFTGKILNVRIFNPGTHRIIAPNCPSSTGCATSLGIVDSTNKNCIHCSSSTTFYGECRICPSGTFLSNQECIAEEEETTTTATFSGESVSKGATTATKAVTQVVSAISSGSSIGLSASIAGKVFSNIKFINISYSYELQNALETWTSNYFTLGFDTDMPNSMVNRFVEATLPYVFAKHQVVSIFLINFWDPLVMLLILVFFLLIVMLFDWVIPQWRKRTSLEFKIIARIKLMALNFLVSQLYGVYGDFVFYAILDLRSTHKTAGMNLLNLFIIIILLAAMILGFFLHLNLLKRYQNVKKSFGENVETKPQFERFLSDHAGMQVLFDDFKDSSLAQQSFLFILTIRDILFSVILTTLFDHPLTECILILLMSIGMLAYLFIKKPLNELANQIQQVVLELITMAVSISVLILAVFDTKKSESSDQREKIGKALIIMNMIFNFLVILFMLLGLVMQGWEIYKDYKASRQEKKLPRKDLQNKISPQDRLGNPNTNREGQSETNQTMIKTHFDDSLFQKNTMNEQAPESSLEKNEDNSSFIVPNQDRHSPILSAQREGIHQELMRIKRRTRIIESSQ